MTHDDLIEILARIDTRLSRIEKEVLGNGQPGLVQRLGHLEQWKAQLSGAKIVLVALGLLATSSVAGAAITHYLR